MRNPLFLKVLAIGFMLLLIGVPLSMIGSIVQERQARQAQAIHEIGESYAGAQRLIGPVLVMPYTERFMAEETTSDAEGKKQKNMVERRLQHARYVMPSELAMRGDLATYTKRRGLFRAPVYEWQAGISGSFNVPDAVPLDRVRPDSQITWEQPYVAVSLGDIRGLSGSPTLEFGAHRASFEKGSRIDFSENGIHAPVELPAAGRSRVVPFNLKLALRGTERLSVVPLGDSNKIELASSWPHPSFGGRFLPDAQSQTIGPDGFRATWNVSALASAATQQFLRAATSAAERCPSGTCLETLDVRLVEPVNIYTQSDRALKYGFLFLGITFAAFFLFELMKRLRIHPAQYFLVGLALTLFFLLVLSLSEHIAFAQAYLASAAASIGLIGFYLVYVLHSAWRGIGFAAVLAMLYAALYGLLVSEDNALMLGSLLLFGLLATAMFLTRRLDWYRLGSAPAADATGK